MAAININKEQFEQMINGDKPLLVDYMAPWCVYCRRLGPAYDRLAEEYMDKVNLVKIDIDQEPELAGAEQIEVIPTLVLYSKGKAIDSIVVPESKPQMEEFINNALGF